MELSTTTASHALFFTAIEKPGSRGLALEDLESCGAKTSMSRPIVRKLFEEKEKLCYIFLKMNFKCVFLFSYFLSFILH